MVAFVVTDMVGVRVERDGKRGVDVFMVGGSGAS
jgi:hypothetical protein